MKNKLFRSIFAATVTVFVLCLVSFVIVLYFQLSRLHTAELESEAAYLAIAIEKEGADFLTDADAEKTNHSRITLFDPNGNILWSVGGGDALTESDCRSLLQAADNGKTECKTDLFSNHCLVRLKDQSILCVSGQGSPMLTLIVEMLFPFVLILCSAILLSAFFASRVSTAITAPIVRIDPDSPEDRDVYEELLPFVKKFRAQNNQVREQIEQLRVEHEKQDAMRREFTANVSHELKTPLTAISGTAEILENGLVRPEDVSHFAGNIRKEAARLIDLVNDIIELSRLDASTLPSATPEPIALLSLAQDVASRLTLSAQAKSVSLHVSGEECTVNGQGKVLEEMIYNLCDNAIKYNRPGGLVNVTVTNDADATVIAVEDTGIGIPEDEIERIFERFYRVDKSHSKEIGGTGLGLSIVKHGAKLHGAAIDVKSQLGKGTRISLSFPKN